MRTTLTLVALFLLSLTVFAQKNKDIPAFEKVEKANLELKECAIDNDAEGMYLFDQGTVRYQRGPRTLFEMHEYRRVRLKIFKESRLSPGKYEKES